MMNRLLPAALLLIGCPPSTDSGSASDSGGEPGITPGTQESPYFEPIALSIGYTGGWDEHYDALTDWAYEGEGYDGYIRLTLVSEQFFTLSPDDPEREEEYCEIRALFHSSPEAIEARSQDDDSEALLRASFAGHIEIYGFIGTPCYNLDPAAWEGGDPQSVFDGMRLGIGLGDLTDFLADSWTSETLLAYGSYMLASYVAINMPDDSGGVEFIGRDWTTALLWQWEVETGEVLTNDEGTLIGQDINDPVLSGWISSYPYWYQDLDEIDLGRLQEGVEAEVGE